MTSDSKWKHTPDPTTWKHENGTIWCPSAKGGDRPVLDMRGWGYLTGKGHGALGLDSETAAKEQDALALFIIDACKDAASPQPPAGAEVVARVKPLVWEKAAAHQIRAGHYLIEDQGSNWTGGDRYWLFFGGLNATNRIGRYGEQADALAAADENNRLAILTALEPTPPTAEEIARRASPWQPIETAPASGRYLVYQPPHESGRTVLDARIIPHGMEGTIRQTTHWMPLPEPPPAALAKPPGETP